MSDPLTAQEGGVKEGSAAETVAEVRAAFERLKSEIHKVIVGQDDVVEQMLM